MQPIITKIETLNNYKTKKLGLGLLALSGKYKITTKNIVIDEINKINADLFDFVDAAYVYKDLKVNTLKILSRDKIWNKKELNIKIGRNLNLDNNEIFSEFFESISYGWKGPVFIMFHQVEKGSYERHMQIIELFKSRLNISDLQYGLSLHSMHQLEDYKKDKLLKKIQIPFNAVDEYKTRNIIQHCKRNNILIQARSIFGAGLFTGIYNEKSFKSFKDPIRLNWNFSNKDFKDRYQRFLRITQFLNDFNNKNRDKFSVKDLMELYVFTNKNINEIISGGSNYKQINEFKNIRLKPNPSQYLLIKNFKKFLIKYI